MTLTQILTRVYERLDDDGTYYTSIEVVNRVNEGQRFLTLLALPLEKTATLTLTATTTFYHLLSDSGFKDFLLPLRVRVTGGARVGGARLSDLAAADSNWETQAGTPTRYALLGLDLLCLNQQPAGSGVTLDITFAHGPAVLAIASDTPEVPEEYHGDLVDYAIHGTRAKEGGQEFLDSVGMLQRFLVSAEKLNRHVRARSLGKRYDRLPAELRKVDLSRLVRALAPPRAQRKPMLLGERTNG